MYLASINVFQGECAMDHDSLSAGYGWIVEKYRLLTPPLYSRSFILSTGIRRTVEKEGRTEEYYTKSYAPGDLLFNQLVFALKYEGVNLLVLKQLFNRIDAEELTEFIAQKPMGRFHRALWFLYENLTEKALVLPDLSTGNYIDLLDSDKFFVSKAVRSKRHRIGNNLLGDMIFSPMVRRTRTINEFLEADFGGRCRKIIEAYPQELIRDALAYLYTQETRSSFRIEQESLSGNKQERFMQLLRDADAHDYLNKAALIDLHKKVITDPRFHSDDFRETQEYVGSSALIGDVVHLVPPKPEDLDKLMDGLFKSAHRMMDSLVDPVVIAAIVAFGFVYIHPFKDGNGRIHRFLIHHILSTMEFTPEDFVFPVSAVMYQNARRYQDTLNLFSEPLLSLVEYSLNHEGFMTVQGETIDFYRYFDATGIVESLYAFIEDTIDTEYLKELDFLKQFAEAKLAIEQIIDGLPQREARIFVESCRKNGFRISKIKREKFFSQLTEEEIERMEEAVKNIFEG